MKNIHAVPVSDEELVGVIGGAEPEALNQGGTGETAPSTTAAEFAVGDAIRLVGPYYGTSYAEGGQCTAAQAYDDLVIGYIASDLTRPAPYRIDRASAGSGTGWAPASSIQKK